MNPRIAALWRSRLDDLDASLLPVAKWCELRGFSRYRVIYWRRKLAAERVVRAETGNGRWLCVQNAQAALPTSLSFQASITLRVGNATLEVHSGFDPVLLRAIVVALGGTSC